MDQGFQYPFLCAQMQWIGLNNYVRAERVQSTQPQRLLDRQDKVYE